MRAATRIRSADRYHKPYLPEYDELISASLTDNQRLREVLKNQKHVILAIELHTYSRNFVNAKLLKELKKLVRGVRPLGKSVENRDDTQAICI